MTACGPRHDAPRDGSCNCGLVSRHPAATPAQAGDEAIVSALAEVLTAQGVRGENLAAALLPVVHRIAEQRAAEALQPVLDLADELEAGTRPGLMGFAYDQMADRIRAAALTATPNHGRNAT